MNFLNNRQLSADGPEGVGGAIPLPTPGGAMPAPKPGEDNENGSSNAGSAKGVAKGISSLNLKRGYGKGNKIERPLTVDEFEQNFVDLADEINNLKTDVTTALSGLSSVGSGPIKMIGKGTEIDLNPRHLSPQSITFDTEGIYVITDILITNPSAVITNASGGLFIAMDPFSYGNGNAKGGMVPGNMVPGNMVPGNMVPGGMVPGVEEVEVGGLGAGLNQTIIGGHSESSLQGGGVLVAKTNDASLMRAQASTVYGEPNSNRGQGLQALTTGASFINTMVGGPSSDSLSGDFLEAKRSEELILSSSPTAAGITLVQNTLVANELYFMILNPEESDVTCDVYVFGYKIAEVGTLREISSPTTTTTTTEKEEKSPIYFDRDSSEFVSSLEATIVSDGKGFETSYEVYFNTSALQTWFNEEIQKGSDITSIWIEPNLNGSQNGPTVPIIGFVDGSSVVENNSAHGMIAKFENLEFWLSNNPVYTLRIVAGGSQETTLLDTFTLMYESTTTTTTTANSAVTVSFLNQDANGPITWEDYDPSPLMELYRVRINEKSKHETSPESTHSAQTAGASKESPFELVFIENVNFNNDGTLQLELEYSAEYDQRTQGYNMFAYKVYNRSQESPYEKLESELIWYGILQVYANGMVYEVTGDDYPEAYNGVIARPFATSTPVSLTLTGVNGVVMDNVTLYHKKPETQLNYIFGFGNELKLLGVTDVNGQINVTADLEFFNADGTEYVYIVNEEFTDASTSIPYRYNNLYIPKSDIDKDTGILTINYTPEPVNGTLEVFTDNISKFDQNGNQYPGQTIVVNKLGDDDVWEEINWSWASNGNSTEYYFNQGLVSGTYKISLYDNNTGGTYADKGENGYINWDLISEEVVSLFWGETQLVDFRTPATTTTTTEDPATTTTTTEAP